MPFKSKKQQAYLENAVNKTVAESDKTLASLTVSLLAAADATTASMIALQRDGDAAKYTAEQKARLTVATAQGFRMRLNSGLISRPG